MSTDTVLTASEIESMILSLLALLGPNWRNPLDRLEAAALKGIEEREQIVFYLRSKLEEWEGAARTDAGFALSALTTAIIDIENGKHEAQKPEPSGEPERGLNIYDCYYLGPSVEGREDLVRRFNEWTPGDQKAGEGMDHPASVEAVDVENIVERLEEEHERLSGHSIDRGVVESGIAANLAMQAAEAIEQLLARIRELEERVTKLSQERDRYNDEARQLSRTCEDLKTHLTKEHQERDALSLRGQRLEEALGEIAKPAASDHYDTEMGVRIKRARAALGEG